MASLASFCYFPSVLRLNPPQYILGPYCLVDSMTTYLFAAWQLSLLYDSPNLLYNLRRFNLPFIFLLSEVKDFSAVTSSSTKLNTTLLVGVQDFCDWTQLQCHFLAFLLLIPYIEYSISGKPNSRMLPKHTPSLTPYLCVIA